MRNGFRRAPWPVIGSVLPVLWLLAAPRGATRLRPRPLWWEVRIDLAVRGEYTVKDFGTTFAGEFTCRTRWDGSMEPDGPDFLLYHTTTDVPEWKITEKAARRNAIRIVTQKEAAQKPRLRVNFIVRQGDDLRFDFEVGRIWIPLGDSPEKFELVLPRSKECFGEGTGYGDSISKGNNLVAIAAEGLESGRAEKSFSWEWKRQHWAARENGAAFVASSHKVSVTVTLIRHQSIQVRQEGTKQPSSGFSLAEAFFEGTLQRGVPLWRTARMFELESAGDDKARKMGMRIPILKRGTTLKLRSEFRRLRERTIRKGVKNPDGERALPAGPGYSTKREGGTGRRRGAAARG